MEYASAPELPVLLRYFHDLPRWMDGSAAPFHWPGPGDDMRTTSASELGA
jgi:hypothetical protein